MESFGAEREEADLNQYWYDDFTIALFRREIEMHAESCAFLSTPSLYFSFSADSVLRRNSVLFEYDRRWEKDPNFQFYDFNEPEKIPVSLWDRFDYVVVDPPFITTEVWSKYIATISLILKPKGKLLFTSIIENHKMLQDLLAGEVAKSPTREEHNFILRVPIFRPGIPHLTYQYHCFTNYDSPNLEQVNPNLPPEDRKVTAMRSLGNALTDSQFAFVEQWKDRDRTNEVPLPAPTAASAAPLNADPAMKWTRVPEGLTEYAGGASAPPPDAQVDLGPEYDAIAHRREVMENFKKCIDTVMKETDVVMRQIAKSSSAVAATGGGAAAQSEDVMANRNAILTRMKKLLEELERADGGDKDKGGICVLMHSALAALDQVPSDPVKFRELSADMTRQYKSKIFNRQKELLQEMKAIKQRAVKNERPS